jgi:hypothetical protein
VGLCWTEGREKQNIVLKWSGVHLMSKNEMVKIWKMVNSVDLKRDRSWIER